MNSSPENEILTCIFSGDRDDTDLLKNEYHIESYISSAESKRNALDVTYRDKLLRDGIRLSPVLAPRIHRLVNQAITTLNCHYDIEVFCLHETTINAMINCDRTTFPPRITLCMTSRALEELDDQAILHLVGHELGHILFEHDRMKLLKNDGQNDIATVLPYLGECVFLRWQKKAEISADRIGYLVCGDFNAAARALIKCAIGLSDRNLNLDIPAIMEQMKDLDGSPTSLVTASHSHPLLPIRLCAMQIFAKSFSPEDFSSGKIPDKKLDEVNSDVTKLLNTIKRCPKTRIQTACMNLIADQGVHLLTRDMDVTTEEVKKVITILQRHYTDAPEKCICSDRDTRRARIEESIAVINAEGTTHDKMKILSRLADVAATDGKVSECEGQIILETAEKLHIPSSDAYVIINSAIRHQDKSQDPLIEKLARELKNDLDHNNP